MLAVVYSRLLLVGANEKPQLLVEPWLLLVLLLLGRVMVVATAVAVVRLATHLQRLVVVLEVRQLSCLHE